ncbi:MAG: type II secretion system F family protein [Candidatus Micrarchaeota archaeon]|nr:type II secretion system F family protein [Candidatus Micrarchaeota archaeon]
MEMKVPFLLMRPAQAKVLAHYFYGISSRMLKGFKFLERELYKLDSNLTAREYLALVLFNSFLYFLATEIFVYFVALKLKVASPLTWALGAAFVVSSLIFMFDILYPRWLSNKRVAEIDRNLLFAARHLRIQTTAGVPLFESIVSASHGYGAVSQEMEKIATQVQAGTNLADALEESAAKNPSYYYSRILWQMSNAVKAGTDIGPVLSDIVDFLAEEQRVQMRNYGAQLNTLAIMYLMACIIAPTISLIFMMVISSFADLPITDSIFWLILALLVFVQYMFIGIIENRRPVISI